MNVFILNTGRCGSSTFIRACQHITNYTAGHETRAGLAGEQRLLYPPDHIEADNRLSWFLGRLDEEYANDAFYVHLTRDVSDTVKSFSRREEFGIMKAYRDGILLNVKQSYTAAELALDYIHTVDANIRSFLKDKTETMDFCLATAKDDFVTFWNAVAAEGDLEKAINEWDVCYNSSD